MKAPSTAPVAELMAYVADIIGEQLRNLEAKKARQNANDWPQNWFHFLQAPTDPGERARRAAHEAALKREKERDEREQKREKERTAPAAQENTKQGDALKAIILAALDRVMQRIHPAYPEKRGHIITLVLDETNAQLALKKVVLKKTKAKKKTNAQLPDENKVSRDCVRKHLTKYWNENPALAPKK
jgi:hypothetical protein